MTKDIRAFKLSTTEEFIGEVVNRVDDRIYLKNPKNFVYIPQQGFQMAPVMMCNVEVEEIVLYKSGVVAEISEIAEAVEKAYFEATSKIQLIQTGNIVK